MIASIIKGLESWELREIRESEIKLKIIGNIRGKNGKMFILNI